jgi:hypothetical protein
MSSNKHSGLNALCTSVIVGFGFVFGGLAALKVVVSLWPSIDTVLNWLKQFIDG